MKFRRDAPALLISAVLVVIALFALLSHQLFSGLTSAIEASQIELMRSILDSSLHSAKERALAHAEMIADLPSVRKIFEARDRPALLAETQAMFKVQKEKHGVDQAQFHIPPATSFLRLQDPEKFGDDLTAFRPLVVAVNREHTAKKGFAIARTGPAIFGVTPITNDQGQHIGSFEIGIDLGSVLDGMKTSFALESAVYLDESPLKQFAKGVKPEIFSDQNRVGKYIRFYSTNTALFQSMIVDKDLNGTEDGTLIRAARGATYGVIIHPLRSGSGETLGMVVVARDFSGSRSAAGRSLVWQILFALFAVVLLAGAILIVLRGKLLRPLGDLSNRFEALANGDAGQPAPDSADMCDELSSLAQHYERLRKDASDGKS